MFPELFSHFDFRVTFNLNISLLTHSITKRFEEVQPFLFPIPQRAPSNQQQSSKGVFLTGAVQTHHLFHCSLP